MTKSRLLPLALLSLGVGVLGCSGGGNPNAPARVSGSISYKGQPIKAGTMSFVTTGGIAHNALISADGTYTATDIPVGEMVVVIETESINPKKTTPASQNTKEAKMRMQMMQPGPASVEKASDHYIKIPAKYGNAKTSPLTVTLTAGRQVQNFDLTD
jgi:hypothetical protein